MSWTSSYVHGERAWLLHYYGCKNAYQNAYETNAYQTVKEYIHTLQYDTIKLTEEKILLHLIISLTLCCSLFIRFFQVPIFIPILVLLAAVCLVLAPIVDNPQLEYLYVTLFILSGVLIYIPLIHFKLCPNLLNKLTVLLQLFLEVAPADKNL